MTLESCIVRNIYVRADSPSSLQITNCHIGCLYLAPNSIKGLRIDDGSIGAIACPLPGETNPFVGTISIHGAWLSPSSKHAQSYRNLRYHLLALQNHEAASVFHGAEMRALYHEQNWVDRIINKFYRALSDYGASTVRPVIWFAGFSITNFLLFWLTGASIATDDFSKDLSWRSALSDPTMDWLRAAILTFSQVFNPLGVLGARPYVAPTEIWFAIANIALGFGATVSLALFFLALRRRFRLG